jgi:site-specific DNA recombinase
MKSNAAYVRVSSEEQARNGYSIDSQKLHIENYCKLNGMEEPIYYIDEGYSAKNTRRPKYLKLVNDIKDGKIQNVICWKLDRLHRNTLDGLTFIEEVNKNEIQFMSITEKIDTKSSSGKVLLTILLAFAQNEREQISERTKMGLFGSASQGNYPKPYSPYGYNLVNKKLEINEEQSFIVRKIFSLYITENYSKCFIANIIKNVTGDRRWNYARIHSILNNKIYTGTLIIDNKVIENHSPQIISVEVFSAAEIIQKEKSLTSTYDYLFQGLLVNREHKPLYCTTTVKSNGKKYFYYREKGIKNYINESKFLAELIIPKILKVMRNSRTNESNYNKAMLQKNIEKKQQKIAQINKYLIEGVLLPIEAKIEKEILYKEIIELEQEIKLVSHTLNDRSYTNHLLTLSRKELIGLINNIFELIVVDTSTGNILTIKYK